MADALNVDSLQLDLDRALRASQGYILEFADFQHHEELIEFMVRNFSLNHPGESPPAIPSDLRSLPTISAVVNDSRWIVDCPTPKCLSASIVDSHFPLYLCWHCGNQSVQGSWLRVILPPDKRDIEIMLQKRPRNRNRNWLPGKTAADLERENREHGID